MFAEYTELMDQPSYYVTAVEGMNRCCLLAGPYRDPRPRYPSSISFAVGPSGPAAIRGLRAITTLSVIPIAVVTARFWESWPYDGR